MKKKCTNCKNGILEENEHGDVTIIEKFFCSEKENNDLPVSTLHGNEHILAFAEKCRKYEQGNIFILPYKGGF